MATAGLLPSASARTPSGRSWLSTRKRTLRALTRAPVVGRDRAGDRLRVPRAVALGGDRVQEPRQLDDLAVGAPGQPRWLSESGVLELAEQLDAVGEREMFLALAGGDRCRRRGLRDGHPGLRSADVGGLQELARRGARLLAGIGLQHELVVEHGVDPRLLLLDRRVELIDGQVLLLERTELAADVGELGAAVAGEADGRIQDADELPGVAAATQPVQSSLTATARFCGTTGFGEPDASTIWNAIAVASQPGSSRARRRG